jgi:hypothetical protein
MKRAIHHRKSERGQLVIALAIMLPFLMLLAAFVINISLLIHQKVRLQNAVDAGVYASSASFSRDLNSIAELNRNIDALFQGDPTEDGFLINWERSFEDYIADTSYNAEAMAIALYNKYEADYGSIKGEIDAIRGAAAGKATEMGRISALLTYYNGRERLAVLNPSEVSFQRVLGEGEIEFMEYTERTVGRSIPFVIMAGSCNPIWDACEGYDEYSAIIHIPILKNNYVSFLGKANAEPGFTPIMYNRFQLSPWDMTCYAKGQPHGGSIEELSARYGATLIPIGTADGISFYH